MGKTKIEWADNVWNPVVGCSIVSPGCANCYAMKMAARIERMTPGSHYAGTTQASKAGAVWTGTVALAPDHILTQPLRWQRPRRVFVNSMGDIFHEAAPDAWIDRVFAVMALAPQHTFMVLTKRSGRMREYLSNVEDVNHRISEIWSHWFDLGFAEGDSTQQIAAGRGSTDQPWPLRNVWLGVSAEDQRRANERVPDLLSTPAAVRFVSAEPMLGRIDFNLISLSLDVWTDALTGQKATYHQIGGQMRAKTKGNRLDWIIAGGESGPDARPMHPDWARSIRDQCATAGVAYFFKQWGEFLHRSSHPNGTHILAQDAFDAAGFIRVGKARAGRLLDGIEHYAFPENTK